MCSKRRVQNNKVEGQGLLGRVYDTPALPSRMERDVIKRVCGDGFPLFCSSVTLRQGIAPILPFSLLPCKGLTGRSYQRPDAKAFIIDFPAS